MKVAVRFRPLRTVSALAAATRHARREDAIGKSRVREGAKAGEALAWTAYGVPCRDLVAAFKAHKQATGATERANAPLALQTIVVVSPEWIDIAGDRHDPKNPRNRALIFQARGWAESWAGVGSVIGARLDLDERGAGVVDLTIVPTRVQRSRGGKETLRISTNGALADLAESTGDQKSYVAAQSSWASWAQRTLDPTLQRGTPREETKAEHLRPEEFGRVQDELRVTREEAVRIETAAKREAERIERTARQKAEALAARGRAWIADIKVKAEAERERILAPVRTWRGRLAFLSRDEERNREAQIQVVRNEESKAAKALELKVQEAEQATRRARHDVNAIKASLTFVVAERDAAWREVQALRPPVPPQRSELLPSGENPRSPFVPNGLASKTT